MTIEYDIDIEQVYEEKQKVARAMEEEGGSFVHNLGKALARADRQNMLKIRKTFDKYWRQYLEIWEHKYGE